MGKRGPKPKSPELESLQGFPGRRKAKTKAAITIVAEPDRSDNADIQDEPLDSCFVQPPQYLGKRERGVWVEIFSGPNARLWYKFSDHNVIGRYCVMTVQWRQMTKTPPKATYKVTRTPPPSDKPPNPAFLETMIKRNPEFDQMLALSRELRSIEKDVGMNPDARLNMEKKGLKAGTSGAPSPQPKTEDTPRPSGPLGVLKSPNKLN